MSWELKRNVTRIFNVFKRNKDRIYKEDIDALKALDEYINTESKSITTGNLIFAKLFALYLRQNINYYGDIRTAIKALQKELKQPLNYQLEFLTKDLNHNEFINYLKSEGLQFENVIIDKSPINGKEKEVLTKLKTEWSFEVVEKSFYNSANDILKEVENYT